MWLQVVELWHIGFFPSPQHTCSHYVWLHAGRHLVNKYRHPIYTHLANLIMTNVWGEIECMRKQSFRAQYQANRTWPGITGNILSPWVYNSPLGNPKSQQGKKSMHVKHSGLLFYLVDTQRKNTWGRKFVGLDVTLMISCQCTCMYCAADLYLSCHSPPSSKSGLL